MSRQLVYLKSKGHLVMRKVCQLSLLLVVAVVVLSMASGRLEASQAAPQWYNGHWKCTLDGRATKMRWGTETDRKTSDCRYDKASKERICTSSSGIKTVGAFWDRNGPWKKLALQRSDARSLTFRHADGNCKRRVRAQKDGPHGRMNAFH